MAGADYLHCEECWERLVYIGNDQESDFTKVYCAKCYNKLLKRIKKLEKAANRGK